MNRFLPLFVARLLDGYCNPSFIGLDVARHSPLNCRLLILFTLLSTFSVKAASGLDTLDGLLPTPYLLRSRAADLNIDKPTQVRIEKMYKAAEPKYHELKLEVEGRTRNLDTLLLKDHHFNDHFDREVIANYMRALLEAENRLKLYQVRVRISLLSQVSAEQRQGARNYASEKLEAARWRGDVLADGKLDTLLPKPFWLRSRSEELGIDAATRKRLEQTYKSLEPKYHEFKQKLEPLKKPLFEVLLADNLDEEAVVNRFNALLKVEKELKLHQVHVRTSLLLHLSAEQRRAAQRLVKRKPEADWRKILTEKIERVRQLSKQLSARGESVADIEQRLMIIEELISEGSVSEGGRTLDQVIRDLESLLEEEK